MSNDAQKYCKEALKYYRVAQDMLMAELAPFQEFDPEELDSQAMRLAAIAVQIKNGERHE